MAGNLISLCFIFFFLLCDGKKKPLCCHLVIVKPVVIATAQLGTVSANRKKRPHLPLMAFQVLFE